jgi:hypothetical protein
MLDPQPTLVQRLVRHMLLPRAFLAAWFLGRHEDLDLGQRERQEAQILQQPTARGQGIRRRIRNGLIMGAAAIGVTEEKDNKQRIDQEDIFYCMVLFLAALTLFLFSRVLGADNAPFGPVMGKRGESDVATGAATTGAASSSSGATTGAASASETPSRWARAVRERAGASPRVRRAASSAGKRT